MFPRNLNHSFFRINENEWKGVLKQEAPGIIDWVLQCDKNRTFEVLTKNPLSIPGLAEGHKLIANSINLLILWVEEDLIVDPDGKSYLGFSPHLRSREELRNLVATRKELYPSYLLFCKKRGLIPLNHVNFSSDLIQTCEQLNIPIKKVRDQNGYFIKGLSVKEPFSDTPLNVSSVKSSDNTTSNIEKKALTISRPTQPTCPTAPTYKKKKPNGDFESPTPLPSKSNVVESPKQQPKPSKMGVQIM